MCCEEGEGVPRREVRWRVWQGRKRARELHAGLPRLSGEADTGPCPTSSHPLIFSVCSSTVTEHLVAKDLNSSLYFLHAAAPESMLLKYAARRVPYPMSRAPRLEAGRWKIFLSTAPARTALSKASSPEGYSRHVRSSWCSQDPCPAPTH